MPTHKERAEKRNVSLSKLPLLNWDFKPGDEVMYLFCGVKTGVVESTDGHYICLVGNKNYRYPKGFLYPAHPETKRFLNYVTAMNKRIRTTQEHLDQRIALWKEQTKTGRATGENPNFKP